MNKRIGMIAALLNIIAVVVFAFSMIIEFHQLSYISSMFIAFSFVAMICSFCFFADNEKSVAGYTAMTFAGMYAILILIVYFAQVTVVRFGNLAEQANKIIDFQQFGLFFSYDLLGYGLMALSTFFIGLTIDAKTKGDKCLKALLLIHGLFFISCFIIPMTGAFSVTNSDSNLIGTILLEFWCLYFIPIGILSFRYFKKMK